MHHVLSTVMMDDPAVFTNFVRNTLEVSTQQKNYVITNFVKSFGYLIAANDGDIDNFSKIPILRIIPDQLRK